MKITINYWLNSRDWPSSVNWYEGRKSVKLAFESTGMLRTVVFNSNGIVLFLNFINDNLTSSRFYTNSDTPLSKSDEQLYSNFVILDSEDKTALMLKYNIDTSIIELEYDETYCTHRLTKHSKRLIRNKVKELIAIKSIKRVL